MKQLIYIASPYTIGDVAKNVSTHMDTAHEILDLGHVPIAPLLTHYLHIHRQRPHEDWMQMDLAILPRVDILLRLEGESIGADREVRLARSLDIPVVFGTVELEKILRGESDE